MQRQRDTYVAGPGGFSANEEQLARSCESAEPLASRLFFCSCAIDTEAHALYISGLERHLEPRGFEVLLYLIRQRHRFVSKHELLDVIWPTCHVTENVVARCVMKLRRAIGDDARGGRMIRTIHRIGYRFDAKVEEGWSCDRERQKGRINVAGFGHFMSQPQRQPVALTDSVRMALYAPVAKSVDAQDLKII